MTSPARVLLLMGVSGSGKTTIGQRLATELGWPYFEADDFHPPANKEKMSRGLPLDDQDRAPWLASIRAEIDACLSARRSAIFTCSALKASYRTTLLHGTTGVALTYLQIDLATVKARVAERSGHFMKADMVDSQFATLEIPTDAFTVDARQSPEAIIAAIRQHYAL